MPRRTHRSRSRTLVNIGAAVAALAAVAYGASLIQMPDFDFSSGRRHLRQIPIDRAESCGEVEAIHAQLDAFGQIYFAASFGADPETLRAAMRVPESGASTSSTPAPLQFPAWPVVKAELEVAAQQLDAALAEGSAHFPKRIRTELGIVRTSLAEGRVRLVTIDSVQRFNALTEHVFERGQLHAGYASDLVGHQCHVPLGA